MPCFCGQEMCDSHAKSPWASGVWVFDKFDCCKFVQIFPAFLAEEITSLIRGPDFDPYESGERWDPLLAIHKGGRRDDPGWWDVSQNLLFGVKWGCLFMVCVFLPFCWSQLKVQLVLSPGDRGNDWQNLFNKDWRKTKTCSANRSLSTALVHWCSKQLFFQGSWIHRQSAAQWWQHPAACSEWLQTQRLVLSQGSLKLVGDIFKPIGAYWSHLGGNPQRDIQYLHGELYGFGVVFMSSWMPDL